MTSVRFVLPAVALGAVIGCATPANSGLSSRSHADLRPIVLVSNLSARDVEVVLIRDQARVRLGRVPARGTAVYPIANTMLIGATVRADVFARGMDRGHVVGPFTLTPRAGFRIVVGDVPELTTVVLRYR